MFAKYIHKWRTGKNSIEQEENTQTITCLLICIINILSFNISIFLLNMNNPTMCNALSVIMKCCSTEASMAYVYCFGKTGRCNELKKFCSTNRFPSVLSLDLGGFFIILFSLIFTNFICLKMVCMTRFAHASFFAYCSFCP